MARKCSFPTDEEIRAKAYEIYLARGCKPGHADDDWLQAEYELIQLPVDRLAKLATPKSKRPKFAVAALTQAALLIGGFMS